MSDTGKRWVLVAGSLVFCSAALAITDDSANPYKGIVERNVFGLKPPTPVVAPTDSKPKDLPPITLTGITTILGNKRVLMNLQVPGKQAQSFILTEGQREGEIEILEIDEKAGSVKLNQSGTPLTLTFEKNGAKLPSTPVVASGPGIPTAVAPGGQYNSAFPTPVANPGAAAQAMKSIPTRPVRQTGTSSPSNDQFVNSGANGSGLANPAFPVPGSNPIQRPLSPEEGVILMEANYQVAVGQNDPAQLLFPPTELDPKRNTSVHHGDDNVLPGQSGVQSPTPAPRGGPPIGTPFPLPQ